MTKITSFEDAQAAIANITELTSALQAFLKDADETLSAVDRLKGRKSPTVKVQRATLDVSPIPRAPDLNGAQVPDSWADKVTQLFRASKSPLSVQQVIAEYKRTGWPVPDSPKILFRGIYGAMHYLAHRKGLLIKNGGLYRLAESEKAKV